MTSRKDACKALGELFIMGFSGLELSEQTSSFITEAGVGGVILFSQNFENMGQLGELTNQIQDSRSNAPLWVSVDYEGGRVQRFKKGFTKIPDAASIGAMNSPRLTYEISELIARELKAVGVNLNFCPVGDIATNSKNPVIGNRSFGDTEELVSKMCTAMVRGHLTQGVQPCIKHFPGHGDTSTDSHFALPRIDTSLEMLQTREFNPFIKAFKSHCSMVMTAHILNPKVDPKFPATLSSRVLQDVLRKELRYNRIIISDDMEMKAIADHFGAEDAPRLALEAGCDILIYRSEAGARKAYEALIHAIEDGKLAPEVIFAADSRIKAYKKECLPSYQPLVIADIGKTIGTPEHQDIIDKVQDRTHPRK